MIASSWKGVGERRLQMACFQKNYDIVGRGRITTGLYVTPIRSENSIGFGSQCHCLYPLHVYDMLKLGIRSSQEGLNMRRVASRKERPLRRGFVDYATGPTVSAQPSSAPSVDDLQKQLEALQEEAEGVQYRANSARARFVRLSEAADQLRHRAALDVKAGREESAVRLLQEKQKVMQALDVSKKRAAALEELSAKLNEAISRKESQLIAALSCAQLDMGTVVVGSTNGVRVVPPAESLDAREHAGSEVVGDRQPVEVAEAKPDSGEETVLYLENDVSRNLEHNPTAPSSNADNTSFAEGCGPGVTQAGAQDEGMHQDVHAGDERADSIFTNQDYQHLIQQYTQELMLLESGLRFLLEAIPHRVTRGDDLKLLHEDLLKHRRRIYRLVRMLFARWDAGVTRYTRFRYTEDSIDTGVGDHQLNMQKIKREMMALEADLRFLLEAIPFDFDCGDDLELHYENLEGHRARIFDLLTMCLEHPDV